MSSIDCLIFKNMYCTKFSDFLVKQKKAFRVEKNLLFSMFKANIYAYRRYNLLGRDYLFIHEGNSELFSRDKCFAMHEAARKYVNDQYKIPKIFRFVVPNIASIFLSDNGFSDAAIELALQQTRPWQGGEVHDMFFIDTSTNECFGPDFHKVRLYANSFTVKKVDPTNRSIELVADFLKQ